MLKKRIFIIGKELKHYKKTLSLKRYEVTNFDSPPKAKARLGSADLLMIDAGMAGSAGGEGGKDLIKAYRHIPKLVVSTEGEDKGTVRWSAEPLMYSIVNPSERQLLQVINRALAEKEMLGRTSLLEDHLNMVKKELTFFEEINKMLTSSVEMDAILVMIMKKVQELTQAEAWSIIMVDEETGDLVFERTEGRAKKKVKKFRLKPGEGIAGWVAKEGVPVIVPDVTKDTRFSDKIDRQTKFRTKSLMCVPIKSKEQTLAVLEVINKKTGEPFSGDDLGLLLRLTNQAALVLERASLYQKMEELVITDDLTKLFNTRYLNRTIETEVMRSNRYHTSLSLIFMDIDYFKLINDNYGHLVGSKVLVEMGQLLINQLRSIDIVARYGGDEFVIVLPQTAPPDAVRIAERIRKAIEMNTFLKKDGYDLRMTSSFGVASYPESAKTKEDLLRIADEAMYRVKHTTRNGVFAII